jgi:hypothetical protein
MPNLQHRIVPQHSTGRGFEECEPHRATRWAVIEVKIVTSGKRKFRVVRTLATTPERRAAEEILAVTQRNAKPLSRPTLGGRFPRTGRAIIARGIGRNLPKEK